MKRAVKAYNNTLNRAGWRMMVSQRALYEPSTRAKLIFTARRRNNPHFLDDTIV